MSEGISIWMPSAGTGQNQIHMKSFDMHTLLMYYLRFVFCMPNMLEEG